MLESLGSELSCGDLAVSKGNLTDGGSLGRGDSLEALTSLNKVDCCLAAGILPFSSIRLLEYG